MRDRRFWPEGEARLRAGAVAAPGDRRPGCLAGAGGRTRLACWRRRAGWRGRTRPRQTACTAAGRRGRRRARRPALLRYSENGDGTGRGPRRTTSSAPGRRGRRRARRHCLAAFLAERRLLGQEAAAVVIPGSAAPRIRARHCRAKIGGAAEPFQVSSQR